MLKHLEVLAVEPKSGTSKAGNAYQFLAMQGTMHHDDGRVEVFVYDFWPRKGEALPNIKPGRYVPVLETRPNNQTRKLESVIVHLKAAA